MSNVSVAGCVASVGVPQVLHTVMSKAQSPIPRGSADAAGSVPQGGTQCLWLTPIANQQQIIHFIVGYLLY